MGDVCSLEIDLAAVRFNQPDQRPPEGGFARASATHHSQTLLGDNHGQAFSGFFMEG
jgi:hypothetical protein